MTPLSADDRTQVLEDASFQFWRHIRPIVQIAMAIHVLLLLMFVALDIPALYLGNALSLFAYAGCEMALRRRRFRLAGMLICSEIILHAALATWVLGWDSNFYMYMFCTVPILAFSFQTAPVRRALLSMSILLVLLGGYTLRRRLGLAHPLSPGLMDTFGIGNIVFATALLMQTAKLSVRFTRSMHYHLFQKANRDSLTDLYTRRRILQRVPQLLPGVPVAVVMLDIDHFKDINDRYGHDRGDLVLQRVAQAINDSVRLTDMASRWGGEEFMVLMPDTSMEEARQVAERIQLRLRQVPLSEEVDARQVTATFAIAQIRPGEDFLDGLKRTDQALYEGKQRGRDRIMQAH
ncbi:diguanylate cyclase [Pseudomonas sp. HR96]|uniref:GGDEF domain-containing protein n=1 Tax=Pseudomonas sp. HR96 TaxID=1027966 RepID=UPI002A757461|nr:diguanylate cyclase [Pseudomonas sp. HR96]WPO97737.1 diguanylate cyclase [Pseudomonas sp. HR96]